MNQASVHFANAYASNLACEIRREWPLPGLLLNEASVATKGSHLPEITVMIEPFDGELSPRRAKGPM